MKTTILSLTALAFVFFTFHPNASAQKKAKDKVLVNKVFVIEMTETTSKKVGKKENDEISFKSEKLNSKWMTSNNHFPAAPYTVEVDSSSTPWTVTFTSEGKNTDGEDIKWEGTVTGEEIDGTATLSKKGKTKKEYAYTGTLKVKGAKK
ncbi:MAG: hypothetical protein EPN85_08795 [Bacteroidetes bacterium]|nr:MAG: hypothetical protein EPN85_08795 [Bacteroidota bacterium]